MIHWTVFPPMLHVSAVPLHGGILTGHWEFDLAIALVFFAVISYSFLLPVDAPKGGARVAIQSVAILFFVGALVLAVVGFRNL
jgi:hypothetical protein